jgi:hypothetical protein
MIRNQRYGSDPKKDSQAQNPLQAPSVETKRLRRQRATAERAPLRHILEREPVFEWIVHHGSPVRSCVPGPLQYINVRDKPNLPDLIRGGSAENPLGAAVLILGGGKYAPLVLSHIRALSVMTALQSKASNKGNASRKSASKAIRQAGMGPSSTATSVTTVRNDGFFRR